MAYLIDSDWLIDHLAENPAASELIESLSPEGSWISVITYMEAFQGTLRSSNPNRSAQQLQSLTENTPVLLVDLAVAERSARIRDELMRQGERPRDVASILSSRRRRLSTV